MRKGVKPTGRESPLAENDLIVTKTDLKGRITYANEVFLRVSHFRAEEVLGEPHSINRHPDMPRCVFRLLWERVQSGREIFAYVVNLASNGDHYWVFAHVTPSYDQRGNIVGYHSNRRKPDAHQVATIADLYRTLRAAEAEPKNRKDGMMGGAERLNAILADKGVGYDEFVFSI
ncbi:PAS domain-containing protein [Acuticoccus kandeliae]|uniref:PAS domain-containing protein n=1 Tax=Acuticoccus kandeliae TaxID=2073160 RepID=UPI000D3ED417|nr:PAS domain-containing protein [Acuticoccus kandeliae]